MLNDHLPGVRQRVDLVVGGTMLDGYLLCRRDPSPALRPLRFTPIPSPSYLRVVKAENN